MAMARCQLRNQQRNEAHRPENRRPSSMPRRDCSPNGFLCGLGVRTWPAEVDTSSEPWECRLGSTVNRRPVDRWEHLQELTGPRLRSHVHVPLEVKLSVQYLFSRSADRSAAFEKIRKRHSSDALALLLATVAYSPHLTSPSLSAGAGISFGSSRCVCALPIRIISGSTE